MTNPDAKFRRDAVNTMASYSEATNLRLDRTEKTVSQLVDGIQKLTSAIKSQSANVARLERAILTDEAYLFIDGELIHKYDYRVWADWGGEILERTIYDDCAQYLERIRFYRGDHTVTEEDL